MNNDLITNPAQILDENKLSPMQLRYWRKLARENCLKCKYVDAFRRPLKELRALGLTGPVYRASTGGRWGKSAQIVNL